MAFENASNLSAADVMTRNVATVTPHTSLRAAAKLMASRKISGLPVVNAAGKLVGMVTEADLLRPDEEAESRHHWWLDMLAEGHDLSPEFLAAMRLTERPVEKVMHHEVVTVEETTPLRDVAKLIVEKGIKRVMVVNDGKLVGVVSRADLVEAIAQGRD